MKWAVVLAIGAVLMSAQTRGRGVVLEVTGGTPEQWDSALNNVENLRKSLGNVETEVVVHGKALPMLQKNNADQAERLAELARAGVTFAACENTMRRNHVERGQLFSFVKTVDSGVAEIVRKQQKGWSYLKAGG